MAARRKRRRRRRGRFGFLYKLLSVVLILCAIIGGSIIFFRVEEITVTGNTVYTSDEVIAASGVELGDNLFLLNQIQSSRQILEQLPYISDVNLRRSLPNALTISVTECIPAGVVEAQDGTCWIIDTRGKLLEQTEAGQGRRITGLTPLLPQAGKPVELPEEQIERLERLKLLLTALAARNMLPEVDYIDLTGTTDILMGFQGRFTVKLPLHAEEYAKNISVLRQAADSLNAGQTGTIDLTLSRPSFIPN